MTLYKLRTPFAHELKGEFMELDIEFAPLSKKSTTTMEDKEEEEQEQEQEQEKRVLSSLKRAILVRFSSLYIEAHVTSRET